MIVPKPPIDEELDPDEWLNATEAVVSVQTVYALIYDAIDTIKRHLIPYFDEIAAEHEQHPPVSTLAKAR